MKKSLFASLMAFAVASLVLAAAAQAEDDRSAAKPPKEWTLDCGNGVSERGAQALPLKLVLIPAGEFMMGSDEAPEQVAKKCDNDQVKAGWFQNELPQHRVKITRPFYLGAYAVTQAQYEAVMGSNPSYFKRKKNNPVDTVSWYDAVEFCGKLSQKTGMALRLPTEAEWEYACRAGTTTPFNFGETISTDQANYNGDLTWGNGRKGDFRGKTVPVGSFPANGFGLYDMHGNVCEWCQDWYDAGYYSHSPADDPQGPEKAGSRVLRGSSWLDDPRVCRSADRRGAEPADRRNYFGFRIVCAPKP